MGELHKTHYYKEPAKQRNLLFETIMLLHSHMHAAGLHNSQLFGDRDIYVSCSCCKDAG